jgi:ADP-ribose pyrophosphatase
MDNSRNLFVSTKLMIKCAGDGGIFWILNFFQGLAMPPDEPETIIATGRYLQLVSVGGYEYVRRCRGKGVVAILAVTDKRDIILIEQRRIPIDGWIIELPAGLVGDEEKFDGEELEDAARRELLEETGYAAESMELVAETPSAAGITPTIIKLFRARGLRKAGPGGGDASGMEQIRVHAVPLADIDGWLERQMKKGLYVDPKLYWALRHV